MICDGVAYVQMTASIRRLGWDVSYEFDYQGKQSIHRSRAKIFSNGNTKTYCLFVHCSYCVGVEAFFAESLEMNMIDIRYLMKLLDMPYALIELRNNGKPEYTHYLQPAMRLFQRSNGIDFIVEEIQQYKSNKILYDTRIKHYISAFSGLPGYLRDLVGQVWCLTCGTFDALFGHRMGIAGWMDDIPGSIKKPIYIDLGKPPSSASSTMGNTYTYTYIVNAIHEAAHLWDMAKGMPSNDPNWKKHISENGQGKNSSKKVYDLIYKDGSGSTFETFAGAVVWYELNSSYLKSNISQAVYEFIDRMRK